VIERSARAIPKTSVWVHVSSLIMNLAAYELFDLPEGETFLSCAAFEPHVEWKDADELPHISTCIMAGMAKSQQRIQELRKPLYEVRFR